MAVLRNLDLIVTADTSLGHLAGALGVPTWLALSTCADWRWLRGREDTPWYPTVRLFRQDRRGDWAGVFTRMAQALRERLATVPSPPQVAVSVGELADKVTILEIKRERITDAAKVHNVETELNALRPVLAHWLNQSTDLPGQFRELKSINEALWEIEDALRECERYHDFGEHFVTLARSVYHTNDRRAALKLAINASVGSQLMEEKSYREYPTQTD